MCASVWAGFHLVGCLSITSLQQRYFIILLKLLPQLRSLKTKKTWWRIYCPAIIINNRVNNTPLLWLWCHTIVVHLRFVHSVSPVNTMECVMPTCIDGREVSLNDSMDWSTCQGRKLTWRGQVQTAEKPCKNPTLSTSQSSRLRWTVRFVRRSDCRVTILPPVNATKIVFSFSLQSLKQNVQNGARGPLRDFKRIPMV